MTHCVCTNLYSGYPDYRHDMTHESPNQPSRCIQALDETIIFVINNKRAISLMRCCGGGWFDQSKQHRKFNLHTQFHSQPNPHARERRHSESDGKIDFTHAHRMPAATHTHTNTQTHTAHKHFPHATTKRAARAASKRISPYRCRNTSYTSSYDLMLA